MANIPSTTLEFLRRISTNKARATDGRDIWRAMRTPSLVTIVGRDGSPLSRPINHQDVAGFRLTQRGRDALAQPSSLPTWQSLPRSIQHWLSGLQRTFRNVPQGVHVTYNDHELEIRNETGVIGRVRIPI